MARPLIPFVQNGYYASRNWIPLVKGNGFTTSGGGEQEEVWETASGSIVTFDAVAAPLRQLSVAVEPVQNLNGYDNPWPAGGGKNKCVFWHYGYIKEDGTIQEQSTNGISQEVYVANGQTIVFSAATAGSGRGIAVYSGSGLSGLLYRSTAWTTTKPNYLVYTATQDCFVVIWYNYNNSTTASQSIFETAKLQIEFASTPTSYAPYSNICPISGWDSVTVNRTGKNLFDFVDYSTWSNGYLTANGTPSGAPAVAPAYERCSPHIPIKGGQTYTLSYAFNGSLPSGGAASNNVCFYDGAKVFVGARVASASATAITVTAPSSAAYMRFSVRTYDIAEDYQLELGSTATAYEPYSGNQYTIQLGETVYGGTLDVVNGKMTVERKFEPLNNLTSTIGQAVSWTFDSNNNVFSTNKGVAPTGAAGAETGILSSCYAARAYGYNGSYETETSIIWAHTSGTLRVRDTRFTDVNSWLADVGSQTVCYPLATPFELTLTPEQISTLQGTNNVWSNAGDVTVEYRAQ